MKFVTVVGARPQFVKAAVVSRALERAGHDERLVHTGQHYDRELSGAFFDDLGLRQPVHNLEVGSGPHGAQTGAMLAGIEPILMAESPDAVIVYGDTNSTLAGALAAVKLRIPLAHVEAGLRSGRRNMPEEINRVVADHVSDLLFVPTESALRNLEREGLGGRARLVGDVMLDAVLHLAARADARSDIIERLKLTPGTFGLVTIHRAENTDDPARLRRLIGALARLGSPLVFPMHPRTRAAVDRAGLGQLLSGFTVIAPVGYFDMIRLERAARVVLTDSGGVQKESFILGTPCVTLRDETEWLETLAGGWNTLAGTDPARIAAAWSRERPPGDPPSVFGDGHAGERITALVAGLGR